MVSSYKSVRRAFINCSTGRASLGLQARRPALLFLGLLGRGFLYVGRCLLQLLHSLAVEYIDAGFAFTLRERLVALAGYGHFFGPFASVGSNYRLENAGSSSFF